MKTSFKKGDTVEVKKKYHHKISILPGTRMLVSEFRIGGNIR